MLPRFHSLIAIFVIFAAAAVYAAAADQPQAPQNSKPQDSKTQDSKPQDVKKAAVPAGAAGDVVFIDPATGKIRQPDPSEIGALVNSTSPAPKAPVSTTLIQGPGGAVGARLGEDALSYMVVTTAPDGKLDLDCVTGEKAATARVTAVPSPKTPETSSGPVRPQVTQHPQDTQRPQDTQNVKIPR